ncbi:MAG: IclR family transcriptional regulator [Spirochaetes bacterium]|nr:IclR family transcriptional regulator [Spirochaetota bacterium]
MKKASKNQSADYKVPSLDRALRIIELIAASPEGLGVSEITASLKYPKNNVFRIVMTLLANEYLVRDVKSLRFSLSKKILSLGFHANGGDNLIANAIDIMKDLRDKTRETVLIGSMLDDMGVVLEQIPGTHHFKFLIDAGTMLTLHTSAPCKAIIAAMPANEQERMCRRITYKKYNDHTIVTERDFLSELARIRENGFAIDNAEEYDGVSCIGAAVLNHLAYPVGAIWITGPSFRITKDVMRELGPVVADHAQRISKRLGYGYMKAEA